MSHTRSKLHDSYFQNPVNIVCKAWPLVHSSDRWPPPNTNTGHYIQHGAHAREVWDSYRFLSSMRYHVYKAFRVWSPATKNDLWSPQNITEIMKLSPSIHMSSFTFIHIFLLEIPCSHSLTSGNLKWPLTSTRAHRDHLLSGVTRQVHAKYQIHQSFPLKISCLQAFQSWPLVISNNFDLNHNSKGPSTWCWALTWHTSHIWDSYTFPF